MSNGILYSPKVRELLETARAQVALARSRGPLKAEPLDEVLLRLGLKGKTTEPSQSSEKLDWKRPEPGKKEYVKVEGGASGVQLSVTFVGEISALTRALQQNALRTSNGDGGTDSCEVVDKGEGNGLDINSTDIDGPFTPEYRERQEESLRELRAKASQAEGWDSEVEKKWFNEEGPCHDTAGLEQEEKVGILTRLLRWRR